MLSRIITSLTCLTLLAGCSTYGRSSGLGALIGAGTGAAIGGIADPGSKGQYRTRNVVIGAAIGGAAGLAAGGLVHNGIEDRKKDAFLKGQSSSPQPAGAMPQLSTPKVESRWIEGRAVGNRYIEGHFEHVIKEPVRWEN